jgi:hypothetical protein
VKAVAAGLDGCIDDRAAAAAELSRIVAGLDLKLRNCIDVRFENVAAVVIGVVINSVEDKVVEPSLILMTPLVRLTNCV